MFLNSNFCKTIITHQSDTAQYFVMNLPKNDNNNRKAKQLLLRYSVIWIKWRLAYVCYQFQICIFRWQISRNVLLFYDTSDQFPPRKSVSSFYRSIRFRRFFLALYFCNFIVIRAVFVRGSLWIVVRWTYHVTRRLKTAKSCKQ